VLEVDEEEDDKAAELEALLEQFREPEEPPRKKNGVIWYVAALLLAMGGCWLAVQATKGSVLGLKSAAPAPEKPAKSKDRTAYYVARDHIDAEADYRERCRKGMTEKEVRWIVEDFRNEGLAEGPGSLVAGVQETFEIAGGWEEWTEGDEDKLPITEGIQAKLKELSLKLANRQQAWYCGALADGLRFTREQKAEAWNNSRSFVADSSSDFLQYETSGSGEAAAGAVFEEDARTIAFPTSGLLMPERWIRNERCAPWSLCDLNASQREVVGARADTTVGDRSKEEGNDPGWFQPERTVLVGGKELSLPDGVDEVGGVLPLTGEQSFPRDGNGNPIEKDMLAVAMKLHPAQLKLLLLLDPDRASLLQDHLEPGDR
jgi:hypothetical protein